MQQPAAPAERSVVAIAPTSRAGGPQDQKGYDRGASEVRHNPEALMAERRAQHQLYKYRCDGPDRERTEAWRACIRHLGQPALPPLAGEQREADDGAEENLPQAGVSHRNRDGQKEDDRKAAE